MSRGGVADGIIPIVSAMHCANVRETFDTTRSALFRFGKCQAQLATCRCVVSIEHAQVHCAGLRTTLDTTCGPKHLTHAGLECRNTYDTGY